MLPKSGADVKRIGVDPIERKCAALVRLYFMYHTAVVRRKINARTVFAALEDKPLAVGRDLRLVFNKSRLAHVKRGCYARNLRVGNPHYTILYAAACSALTADKTILSDQLPYGNGR